MLWKRQNARSFVFLNIVENEGNLNVNLKVLIRMFSNPFKIKFKHLR